MDRFDTDLWSFLKGHTETSLGIAERLQLAQTFLKKVEEIKSTDVKHRDLKPQNVLINLTPDGKWDGEMEITDYGIAQIRTYDAIKAGTSGWAKGEQFEDIDVSSDNFAARLLVFMILLPWNTAWWFIWEVTTTVNMTNPIEKLFMGCKGWEETSELLSEIGSLIVSQSFRDEWACYCRTTAVNIQIDSNTQKSIDVKKLYSEINLNKSEFVTSGTKIHD